MRALIPTLAVAPLLVACGAEPEPVGVPVLGSGTHDTSRIRVEVLATADDGLATPSDLSFDPQNPDHLYITNYGSNSITRLSGSDYDEAWTSGGPGQDHFLVTPMSLAFSDFGNFATCHDTDDLTQGNLTPPEFMGPTLWDTSDRFNGGHGGHLDMLHNSPLGGGMAWEGDNVYWLFDGFHNSLTRYDFNEDHGYGGSDHSDGMVSRWVEGEVSRIEGIPSHLDLDRDSRLLYVADTDNGRIAVLDIDSGTPGRAIFPNFDGTQQFFVDGAELTTLAEGTPDVALLDNGDPSIESVGLELPAGLQLHEGLVWVTDHATSRVLAFTPSGQLVDWVTLDRPEGSLGGIALDEQGRVYVTDLQANEILRISPAPVEE
jgi:DNA-binding beta-propeller fold protein YncE